jgi:hypothetical protein
MPSQPSQLTKFIKPFSIHIQQSPNFLLSQAFHSRLFYQKITILGFLISSQNTIERLLISSSPQKNGKRLGIDYLFVHISSFQEFR